MTESQAKEKLLSIAKSYIGYHEGSDNSNIFSSMTGNLYGWQIHNAPWCDIFVDACFIKAFGYDTGSAITYQYAGCCGAACAESAGYYQRHGAYYYTPEIGDQIFFNVSGGINHTGIVEKISGQTVTTIEGNSSDQVRENTYRIGDPSINGYGRPNWKALSGFDPESMDSMITQEKSPVFEANLDADSEFGPLTKKAVTDFQRVYGLKEIDGVVGQESWKRIFELIMGETLKNGSTGWLVTALQALLNHISQSSYN